MPGPLIDDSPPDFDAFVAQQGGLRRGFAEEPEGIREESDEEFRARLLGRLPRAFDEFALWEVVLIEAMKVSTPPRVLSARRWGVGNYYVMADASAAVRGELADRIRDAVPSWLSVSVVAHSEP